MPGTQILLALNISVQSITEFSAIKILKYAIKDLSIYLAIKTNRYKIHHQRVENFIMISMISSFKQFISDYSAFTLNPNKPSANLVTFTSIPGAKIDVWTDPSMVCWVTIPCSEQGLESLSHSRRMLIQNVTPLSQALEYFTVQLHVPNWCGSQVGINSWELCVAALYCGRGIRVKDLSRSASAWGAWLWWSDTATHHFYYLLNAWNANWWKHFCCLEMLLLGGVHFDYYEKIQFSAFFSDTQCSVWGWTNTSECSSQILFVLEHTWVNYWQCSELKYLFWGFILCSFAAPRQDKILLWSPLFLLHKGGTQWLCPITKTTKMQPRHCKHLVTKSLSWTFSKNKKKKTPKRKRDAVIQCQECSGRGTASL